MNITEISVSYEETCSLPGYSNVRPGVRLCATTEEHEAPDVCRAILMEKARGFVRNEIDETLIANGMKPKYYEGPRFKILRSNARKIILVVPFISIILLLVIAFVQFLVITLVDRWMR